MSEKLRLLLVEDDTVDRMAFERLVQREGLPYDYQVAASTSEAREVLATGQFDFVLMDYMLGDGTAFDLLDVLGETPSLIITGTGDEKVAVEAMKRGVYDYLTKDPMGNYLTTLPIVVEQTLDRWRARRELAHYQAHLEDMVAERTAALQAEVGHRQQAEEALRRSLEETARSQRLLLALSQAAQAVQRARTPEAVYRTIGEEITALGYHATIFTLTDDQSHLVASHLTFKAALLRQAEKLMGLSARGYRFPLTPGSFYQRIIAAGEPVFSDPGAGPVADALPKLARPLAGRLAALLGVDKAIYAPLKIGGETHSLLTVMGADLVPSDVPAMSAFANQAAIAVENARLYKETQQLAAFNESIIQSMAEGIVVQDAGGFFTLVNPAAAEILGYAPEELLGLHWTHVIPADQQPIVQAAHERRRRGEADRYELVMTCKRGWRISTLMSGSPRFDEQGHFAGTMAVFADITERVRAEQALRESEQFLQSVFDGIQDGISVLDADLNVIQVNAWMEKMYASQAPLQDKKCYAVYQQRESPCPWCPSLPALKTGKAHSEIVPYPSEKNPRGWIDLSAFPLKDANGRVVGIIEHVKDITERVQTEQELERYREHLEELVQERTAELEAAQDELIRQERLSTLGKLTATVAHEIRNPLGTVRTAVFAIGDAIGRDETERVERALQLAERNIVRCDNIIRQLLDYTRERVLQCTPTPIDKWLDLVLGEQAIPPGIVCVRELETGLKLPIDHEQLRHAITHVVSNATDALQDEAAAGNQLTVSTHVVEDPAGSRLEIRVRDTGPGIPGQVLEKIFEPLFSTKTFGVGLGLPIVKNIMEQHQGGIQINTEMGLGTTVTLWLPVPGDEGD